MIKIQFSLIFKHRHSDKWLTAWQYWELTNSTGYNSYFIRHLLDILYIYIYMPVDSAAVCTSLLRFYLNTGILSLSIMHLISTVGSKPDLQIWRIWVWIPVELEFIRRHLIQIFKGQFGPTGGTVLAGMKRKTGFKWKWITYF